MPKNNEKKRRNIFEISRESKRSILSIFFFFLSFFLIISLLKIGGKVGEKFSSFLVNIFGIGGAVFIALIFFFLGLLFLSEKKLPFFQLIAGILIFFLAIFIFLGIFSKKLGGDFGKILGQFFKENFGKTGAILLGAFLFFLALSLLFNFSILKFKKEKQKEKIFFKEGKTIFKVKEIFPLKLKKGRKLFFEKKEKTPLLKHKTPPLSLLEEEKNEAFSGDIKNNAFIIKKTFANFEIGVEMGQVNVGPTVTQYTLKPAEGVKLSRISALQNDLALALGSYPLRIEAPIPGKSLVGIEVPNKKRSFVRLKPLFSQKDFFKKELIIPLGRDVIGNPVFANIEEMPHLLVAGATGSGKTVFLNSLIISLLWKNSPEKLRFILIDPKRVEFNFYQEIPHLLASPITTHQKVIVALKWLLKEMERRFEIFHQKKYRDISHYRSVLKKEGMENLPYIILIIDELADIMAAKGREFEGYIVRLAQMSRAVGIHLVLATQRPSVEVLTGLIKANITSRIAFQVASQIDSRTILDIGGAERLLGKGDMLFLSGEAAKPRRIQAPLVSISEIKKVVEFFKKLKKEELEVERELKELLETPEEILSQEIESEIEDEELYQQAKKIVIMARKASASLLQRRLKIGYARAARILDLLEERGVIGPSQGAKPREVYLKPENDQNSKVL